MHLYPLEGEVRSAVAEAKPRQDDAETTNIAEEFVTSEVIQSLHTKVSETQSAIAQSKNVNRDKSLHQFACRTLEHNLERHSDLKEMMDRIKNGENLQGGNFATFKVLVKELLRQTLQDFSGVVASTPVGIAPLLIRESFQPDLIIVDEAATMDEVSLLIPIAHFSPKAWVVVGDISQKPPHITMEHDLGPGKTTSNPFAFQKQTSLLHRVLEGGARHSTLSMNMRAHGNVGQPVNDLYHNDIMLWRHGWEEGDALDAIIAHFRANVNNNHPKGQCVAQVEFTHARATRPSSSSSKVNSTHAKWVMEQVELLLQSELMGVGNNAQKPITVLVVAAYKEQVIDMKKRFLNLTRKLKLGDEQCARIQFKTVDNAQGDEADFVFYDMVTTAAPAFVAERFRLTLGLSRATAFQVVITNRGNFVGHERNEITRPRALELSRAWKYFNDLGVTKRITSCKQCETHEHTTDQCDKPDPDMRSERCERTSCGEKRHIAAFCPNRRCGNCAERGHTAGECPRDDLLCSQCGRQGHDFFNCTTSSGKRQCSICNQQGHTHWRCQSKDGSVTCRRCGKSGHRARDCDEPPTRSILPTPVGK
jgi:hypothetical protein